MQVQNDPNQRPPENYLVWAILTTIFCCFPLGIVSIIKSSKVNEFWIRGEFAASRQASAEARKWAIWSAILAPVLALLFGILMVVFGLLGAVTEGL